MTLVTGTIFAFEPYVLFWLQNLCYVLQVIQLVHVQNVMSMDALQSLQSNVKPDASTWENYTGHLQPGAQQPSTDI